MFNATAQAVTEKLVREVEGRRWTQDTELLALNVEVLHSLLVAFIQVNSKSGAQGMDPLRIPRPGEEKEEGQVVDHRTLLAQAPKEVPR